MGRRLELHSLLVQIMDAQDLPENDQPVYFQPPANVQMIFPCITYHRDTSETLFAGNNPYRHTKRYEVTVLDRNPDTEIPERVAALPMCLHSRTFAADNLNHYIFSLYF